MWLSARSIAAAALACVLAASAVGCSDDDSPRAETTPSAGESPTSAPPSEGESPRARKPSKGEEPTTSEEPDAEAPSTDEPSTKGPKAEQPAKASKPSKAEYREAMSGGDTEEDPAMAKFLDCLADSTYDDLSAKAVRTMVEGGAEQNISKKDDAVLEAAYESCATTQ